MKKRIIILLAAFSLISCFMTLNIYASERETLESTNNSVDPVHEFNDPDHIAELIIGFIKENDMDCNVTVGEKNVTVWLGSYLGKQHYNNEALYKRRTEDSNAIEAFISDNNIDQSMVSIVWPDIVIIDEDPITNEPLFRIKGDADLSGKVDLADLTLIAKYNLNNEAYPLENETAYANADMNGDGVVDGLDISALIENQLGK